MQFVSIASGSKGNCYYAFDHEGGVLIDCGVSVKRIEQAVTAAGGDISRIKAVLLTHEHRDHTSSLGPLLRRYHIPCLSRAATLDALEGLGKIDEGLLAPIWEESVDLGPFHIALSPVSHDAADPVSYQITKDGLKIGMLTDSGVLSAENVAALAASHLLIIEANHDPEMLQRGPYPAFLKRRILGPYGHLSNETTANSMQDVVNADTQHVLLAHLSEKNNLPTVAHKVVSQALERLAPSPELAVLSQTRPMHFSLKS